jgi:hypothetical protein
MQPTHQEGEIERDNGCCWLHELLLHEGTQTQTGKRQPKVPHYLFGNFYLNSKEQEFAAQKWLALEVL